MARWPAIPAGSLACRDFLRPFGRVARIPLSIDFYEHWNPLRRPGLHRLGPVPLVFQAGGRRALARGGDAPHTVVAGVCIWRTDGAQAMVVDGDRAAPAQGAGGICAVCDAAVGQLAYLCV